MKYTLLKKWHESQVEEVGHVFERTYQNCIYYKHRDEEYLSEEVVAPHEIALLVHAGYLEKECEHQASLIDPKFCKYCELLLVEPPDLTLDLWTEEPQEGKSYWYVGDEGKVWETKYFKHTSSGLFRLKTNNCHKTKQSAEEALKRLLS